MVNILGERETLYTCAKSARGLQNSDVSAGPAKVTAESSEVPRVDSDNACTFKSFGERSRSKTYVRYSLVIHVVAHLQSMCKTACRQA